MTSVIAYIMTTELENLTKREFLQPSGIVFGIEEGRKSRKNVPTDVLSPFHI